MPRRRTAWLLPVVALTGLVYAGAGICADLAVKQYTSAAGRYSLVVDPQKRSGAGPGIYSLWLDSMFKEWSSTKPFSLWDAAVADDGSVGGYAYTHGIDGDDGEFVVAIMDAKGSLLREDHIPRKSSRYPHTPANPHAAGLFIDPDNDRFVVRIADPNINEGSETWWTYGLHDGRLIDRTVPRPSPHDSKGLREIVAARPVSGTPLTLVQWYRHVEGRLSGVDQVGTRFALLDLEKKPVWSLVLADDYAVPGDDRAQTNRIREIREQGAILDNREFANFTIREVASNERVEFAVERNPEGPDLWLVREIARAPYVPVGTAEPSTEAIDEIAPTNLGFVVLEESEFGEPESRIHDVNGFDDQARVDPMPGQGPNAEQLGYAATISVTLEGNIYAVARRTGAVHVFDETGNRQQIGYPLAADYDGEVTPSTLTIDDAGQVFVSRRNHHTKSRRDFLHYSAEGTRIGVLPALVEDTCEIWIAQRGSTNRWVIGDKFIYLVSAYGTVLKSIDRRADGQWLDHPGAAVSLSNGWIAIVSESDDSSGYPRGDPRRQAVVTQYSSIGTAVRSWDAPTGFKPLRNAFATDGERYVFLITPSADHPDMKLIVTDDQGNARYGMSLPSALRTPSIFLVRGNAERELWMFDDERTFQRYAMP